MVRILAQSVQSRNKLVAWYSNLWPRSIGNQCLLMLPLGLLFGWFFPGQIAFLQPIAKVFLRSSQIVVMPFLICELIIGFGALDVGLLGSFLVVGLGVLLLLWIVGALAVLVIPSFLPPLITSQFFHAGMFERLKPASLLDVYLPNNIFAGLAGDNFPAVLLFSSVLGILLQGIHGKHLLLDPLGVIRELFARLNKLVSRIAPFGIFALSAINASHLEWSLLLRVQGFFLLSVVMLIVLSVACVGIVQIFTPVPLGLLWRMLKAPLALTASSGQLLIALPMLVANLRQELPSVLDPDSLRTEAFDKIAPLVSLGFSLPTLGDVATLWFIPFAGWYVDRPLQASSIAQMLLTAIPASVSGLKSVVRQGLQSQGLPLDLLQLVVINGDWLYRFKDVLALEGLAVLALLVLAWETGSLTFRLRALLVTGMSSLFFLLALGGGSRSHLARSLEGTYANDIKLMSLRSLTGPSPQPRLLKLVSEPVTLARIMQRGILRVGVRADGMPWAFRNRFGELVGYDIDLVRGLARSLDVRLEFREDSLQSLERWLDEQRIDMAVGGIQAGPYRAVRHQLSEGYQRVHLALVVPDSKVALLQNLKEKPLARPLRIAVTDPQLIGRDQRDKMIEELVGPNRRLGFQLMTLDLKQDFFVPAGQRSFDALLTTAEGGAAWAVLHPRTSLLAPFHGRLAGDLVWAIAGDDAALQRYINAWLAREQARGSMDSLFQHWVLMNK